MLNEPQDGNIYYLNAGFICNPMSDAIISKIAVPKSRNKVNRSCVAEW